MVGDGSYLMMAQELVTAVQEDVKLIVVLVQNHGFASIGALSESLGSQRFGTRYRYRDPGTGALDGDKLPVDLAANAASLGADVRSVSTASRTSRPRCARPRAAERTTVVVSRDRPARPGAQLGGLVGRPGRGGRRDREHPRRPRRLRREQANAEAVPEPQRESRDPR